MSGPYHDDNRSGTLAAHLDRLALCVHRPSGRRPELRAMVEELRIPAGTIMVVAARHLAAGRVSLATCQVLSRYDSRGAVAANLDRHVELGFLVPIAGVAGDFAPSEPFATAARLVLQLQAEAAAALWSPAGVDLDRAADVATTVVQHVLDRLPADDTPAFAGEAGVHRVLPDTAAAQLLGRVTELRYLRSDVHAGALASVGLTTGPKGRALSAQWHAGTLDDPDLRDRRAAAEAETDERWRHVFEGLPPSRLGELAGHLARLPGEDPRPIEQRR